MKNQKIKHSDVFDWVAEYNDRKNLAEMGYSFDSNDLSDYEATVFCEIANIYGAEQLAEMKRKR